MATRTPINALPPSLTEQLENERIRFSMNCATLVVRSADHKTVQLDGGGHGRVPIIPIRLHRGNDIDVSGKTRFFDLEDPTPNEDGVTDKQIVDAVFDWMKQHPSACSDSRLQLQVHGETDPVQPWPGYDNMDPAGIKIILETGADYDLKGLLKYELEVRTTQVDADGNELDIRDEVVDVLNEISQERALSAIVDNESAVEGL